MTNPGQGALSNRSTPCHGLRASRILGCCAMFATPRIASTANQISMIGPNSLPTVAVPRRWTRKRAISNTSDIGTTYGPKIGVATFSPSTALSTEIAGVITPSP